MEQLTIDQMLFESFGTEPYKLARKNDPDTSKEAAESVDTSKLESMVYQKIRTYGEAGCISDEVRTYFSGYPYSSITARYKALMEKGYIEDTGERRAGLSGRAQRVMRAIK